MMDRIGIKRCGTSLSVTAEECKYNTRIKLYPSTLNCDEWLPVEMLCSTSHIFNPDNVTLDKKSVAPKVFYCSECYTPDENIKADENRLRAVRRAKAKLYDYIRCNLDLKYFLTLTIDQKYIDRSSYDIVIKKFSQWADNKVRRNGLKYVGVVERHKKSNGLHFHLLINNSLKLVPSGTVKVPNHKKPIKWQTAERYKIPADQWQLVYNCPEWGLGFTTAIEIIDDDRLIKCSHYLCKYLTKDFNKIGGRYYYSGGKLQKPKYEYCNKSFNDVEITEKDYTFEICNTQYKVVKYEV